MSLASLELVRAGSTASREARDARGGRGVEVEGESRPAATASTCRRPPRIDGVPISPRAQRTACALASVGTARGRGSSSSATRVRHALASEERHRRRPAARGGRAAPRSSARRRSRARRRRPRPAAPRRCEMDAGGQHHGVAEGAREAGLGAVAEHVAADVDERTRGRRPSSAAACSRPSAIAARAAADVDQQRVGSPRKPAMRDSAKTRRRSVRVSGPASSTTVPDSRLRRRRSRPAAAGPGGGSIGSRSQVDAAEHGGRAEPLAQQRGRQRADDVAAAADAEHERRALRAAAIRGPPVVLEASSDGWPAAPVSTPASRTIASIAGGRALEFLVGDHRRALEREVAVDLDPGQAALVFGPHAHRHRARDAVDPQHEHVQRVPRLPAQPLEGVVGGPDVERA